uniref:Pex2_Pex12 domain-containing protein n=1 Tax=Steinernema glaseri TaxID=37863 RepID=A0A1I8A4T4_9BILA
MGQDVLKGHYAKLIYLVPTLLGLLYRLEKLIGRQTGILWSSTLESSRAYIPTFKLRAAQTQIYTLLSLCSNSLDFSEVSPSEVPLDFPYPEDIRATYYSTPKSILVCFFVCSVCLLD